MRNLTVQRVAYILFSIALLSSCVGKKKFTDMEAARNDLQIQLDRVNGQLADCQSQISGLEGQVSTKDNQINTHQQNISSKDREIQQLRDELSYFKEHNTDLLERLEDFALLTQAGAENVKKSLESLNEQNKYIRRLTNDIQRRDSLNMALALRLKRSLEDVNDQDVQIEVKKGVVYVSISDQMLFRSGSSIISKAAESVLEKVARIINDNQNFDVLVEGHTDDVPISTECVVDNWDLSVKRATSVVRMLQTKFGVDANRLTAGGRSEFIPKDTNETSEGRSKNRRTEVILLPKLDEFFGLITPN